MAGQSQDDDEYGRILSVQARRYELRQTGDVRAATKIVSAAIGTVLVSAFVFLVGLGCYAAYMAVAG